MNKNERQRGPRISPEERQKKVANLAIKTATKLDVSGYDTILATRAPMDILKDTETSFASIYGRGEYPVNTFSEVVARHTLKLEVVTLFDGKTGLVLGVNTLTQESIQKSAEDKIAKGEPLSPQETAYVLGKIAVKE
jgi:hypothetical protein